MKISHNQMVFLLRTALCVTCLYLLPAVHAQQLQPYALPRISFSGSESFFTTRDRMNQAFEQQGVVNGYVLRDGGKEKTPMWKLFKRWEYYWELRADMQTGDFPKTNAAAELQKSNQSFRKPSAFGENWVSLGTNTSSGGYAGLGRINCIAFHPTDNNTFWVGSPSGGIWKTTNGGSSWSILNNNQTVLGVSDIVVPSDYATSNTLFIATGDRDGGSLWSLGGGQNADNVSVGVLKSTNGGSTWNATGLSYTASQQKLVNRLMMHPSNSQIMIAATSDGIYKTTNGGTTWTQKNSNNFIDMEFNPGNPSIVYASTEGYSSAYVFRSTDTGETWNIASTVAFGRRSELAVTPADNAVVYQVIANTVGGIKGIWKSTDNGANFSKVNTNTNYMGSYYSDGTGDSTGQGGYDLCIAASPSDANTLFIGSINTWKSTDGGVTWGNSNMWTSSTTYNKSSKPVVHADKHVLAYQSSSVLFEGNDGGIYKTTNGGTNWTDLTNGMVISQIYRIGVAKTDSSKVLAGLQDNGSKKYSGGAATWSDVYGGDGMECIVDNTSATTYMYVTYVRGEIYRNSNGFSTQSTTWISNNITGGQPVGAWVTPYIMNPSNAQNLFAGYGLVYKTTNRGTSWTAASQTLSSSTKLRSLAMAPSNANFLYTADLTNMWRTTDGGVTNWSTVTLPTTANSVTYISVKNDDSNTVWISYGGFTSGSKVYQSTNGGTSWTNISTGLPNVPVMCVIQYKSATNRTVLFAGTDVGVYVKDGSSDWASFNTGLPNVVVTELEIYYGAVTDRLRAGTFGRGLWETEITAPLPVELTAFSARQKGLEVHLNWATATEIKNYGFFIERAADDGSANPGWQQIGFVAGHGNSNSPKEYSFTDKNIRAEGKLLYRLRQADTDGKYAYSPKAEVEVAFERVFNLHQNYPNPFNPVTAIGYTLGADGETSVRIINQLGEEIAVLQQGPQKAGYHLVSWNAAGYPSGVYYCELSAGGMRQVAKLVLMK